MYLSSTCEVLEDLLYSLERYGIYQFQTAEVVTTLISEKSNGNSKLLKVVNKVIYNNLIIIMFLRRTHSGRLTVFNIKISSFKDTWPLALTSTHTSILRFSNLDADHTQAWTLREFSAQQYILCPPLPNSNNKEKLYAH